MLPQIPLPMLTPDTDKCAFRHSKVWKKIISLLAISSAHLFKCGFFYKIYLRSIGFLAIQSRSDGYKNWERDIFPMLPLSPARVLISCHMIAKIKAEIAAEKELLKAEPKAG